MPLRHLFFCLFAQVVDLIHTLSPQSSSAQCSKFSSQFCSLVRMGFGDGGWNCRRCSAHNGAGRNKCWNCERYNPAGPKPSTGWKPRDMGKWGYGAPTSMWQSPPWSHSSPPQRAGRWRGGKGGGGGGSGAWASTPPLDNAVLEVLVDLPAEEWAKRAPKFPRSHQDKVEAARRRKLEAATLGPGDMPLPPAVRQLRHKASQAAQAADRARERAEGAVEAWVLADGKAQEARRAYDAARAEAAKAMAAQGTTISPTSQQSALEALERIVAEARGRKRPNPGDGDDMDAEGVTVTSLLQQLSTIIEGARPQDPPPGPAAPAAVPPPGGPAGGGSAAPAGVGEHPAPPAQPHGDPESGDMPSAAPTSNPAGPTNAFSAALAVLAERQEGNFRPY